MSTDTVLHAVSMFQATLRADSAQVHPAFTPDQRAKFMLLTDVMRDFLKADDIKGLTDFMQGALGRHPDTMSEIMDQVFGRLLCRDWEEFMSELQAA